jgi:hypothetical protein
MNKKQIENIVWHIETNRRVAGDKQVLDDVLKSLKNLLKETAPEVPVQEQYITLKIDGSEIGKVALNQIREMQRKSNVSIIPV